MYLNANLMRSKGLSPNDIINLQLIKQNATEALSEVIEKYVDVKDIERFNEIGLLSYIKPKRKGQSSFELIRLSSKGKELLDNLEIPELTEDSITIFNWVKNVYLSAGKELGNQKKCKMYIEQFSRESGIIKNDLARLIQGFLADEKEFEYSQKLEFLFYKGSSVFNVRFDIHQSRLFQYFQKHEKYYLEEFAKFNN